MDFHHFFLFPKRSLHRTNGNVFRPEPSLVSLLSLIFLFLFSVVLLFFILASAINKWNVCTQNAYYYFCIYFTPTRIFHRLTLSIFMFLSGLQIYEYQISLECLSFIYLYHLLCSSTALHGKHSISRFDQQFHNKIFKSSHFYVFSVHFVSFTIFFVIVSLLPPATFLSFIRHFDGNSSPLLWFIIKSLYWWKMLSIPCLCWNFNTE